MLSTDEAFTSNFYASVGDRITRFVPAELSDLHISNENLLENGNFDQGVEGWTLVTDRPQGVRFGVNLSEEWHPDRTAVAFVETEAHPGKITLMPKGRNNGTRLPVIGGSPVRITGLSACHRCTADLAVTFSATDGTILATQHEALPPVKGGRDRGEYHAISLNMVAPAEGTHVELAFCYDKPFNPVADYSSFIFIGDVAVTLPECRFTTSDSLRPFATFFGLTDGAVPKLYSAPIDVGYVSSNRANVEIHDKSGAVVATALDAGSIAKPSEATLEQIDANCFSLSASQALEHNVFIDDRRVANHLVFSAGSGNGNIHLSSDLLDGDYHRVAVRDPTGCVTLCETYALLPFQQTPWAALQEHDGNFPPPHLAPSAGNRYRSLLAHVRRYSSGEPAAATSLAQIERVPQTFSPRASTTTVTFRP